MHDRHAVRCIHHSAVGSVRLAPIVCGDCGKVGYCFPPRHGAKVRLQPSAFYSSTLNLCYHPTRDSPAITPGQSRISGRWTFTSRHYFYTPLILTQVSTSCITIPGSRLTPLSEHLEYRDIRIGMSSDGDYSQVPIIEASSYGIENMRSMVLSHATEKSAEKTRLHIFYSSQYYNNPPSEDDHPLLRRERDKAPVNQAIKACLRAYLRNGGRKLTEDDKTWDWCGPVLVLRFDGYGYLGGFPVEADLNRLCNFFHSARYTVM